MTTNPADITYNAVDAVIEMEGVSTLCKCGSNAKWIWPSNSRKPEVYCNSCLSEAQHRLKVALGLASAR